MLLYFFNSFEKLLLLLFKLYLEIFAFLTTIVLSFLDVLLKVSNHPFPVISLIREFLLYHYYILPIFFQLSNVILLNLGLLFPESNAFSFFGTQILIYSMKLLYFWLKRKDGKTTASDHLFFLFPIMLKLLILSGDISDFDFVILSNLNKLFDSSLQCIDTFFKIIILFA